MPTTRAVWPSTQTRGRAPGKVSPAPDGAAVCWAGAGGPRRVLAALALRRGKEVLARLQPRTELPNPPFPSASLLQPLTIYCLALVL